MVFFPVMTGEMWRKPAVRRNVAQLREDGYHVIDPAPGRRYDVGFGTVIESPMPPTPPEFIQAVGKLMPRRGAEAV